MPNPGSNNPRMVVPLYFRKPVLSNGNLSGIQVNPRVQCLRDQTLAVTELKYEAQLSLRLMMNCRDAYNLEMARYKDNGKDGVTADQGKTLKSTIDSYLSTFTEVQRNNITGKVRYHQILDNHQYRRLDPTKKVS